MREIVLDTETTGFEPSEGHRIVEIGAVELFNHMPTGNTYHQYINPERAMPREAFEVHGLGDDFLRDKPVFKDIGRAFLDFIGDANLIPCVVDMDGIARSTEGGLVLGRTDRGTGEGVALLRPEAVTIAATQQEPQLFQRIF